MAKFKKRETSENGISIKFDVSILDMLVKYSLCEYITKMNLTNLSKLMNSVDIGSYKYNNALYDRVKLLRYICDAQLVHNMNDVGMIQAYIVNSDIELSKLIESGGIRLERKTSTSSECKYLTGVIEERVQYLCVFKAKDDIIDSLDNIGKSDFISYYEIGRAHV